MKLPVYDTKNQKKGEKNLPQQFEEPVRDDLIKRAVLVVQQNKRTSYGTDPMAGKRASVRLSKRRHDYRGAYGRGASRVPRKIMTRRGTQFNLEGAFAPGTVKGRRAHPPKNEKILAVKINTKENQKAMRSAMAATLNKELLQKRNHKIPTNYPFLLSGDFENIDKTKQLFQALIALGLKEEFARTKQRKSRAGKGKMRGRKYKDKKGPLIIVSKNCPLLKSARNIKGCEIVELKNLNCEHLAPGTQPGRLTFYTENTIDNLEKQKTFMPKTEQRQKKEKPQVKKENPKQKKTQKSTIKKPETPKKPKPVTKKVENKK